MPGATRKPTAEAAQRYGYEKTYTDWRKMLEDPAVQVFDNGGPNDAHAEPCIAAAKAGKHVFCEKPLARTRRRSENDAGRREKAGVKHMVAFNYRFVPAIVQARKLIESGALGRIYPLPRGLPAGMDHGPQHSDESGGWTRSVAGSGALGDLGAHIIDLARFLVGEPKRVMGMTQNCIRSAPRAAIRADGNVDVDDAFVSLVEFENGALGTLEASRFCAGPQELRACFEINGEKGSIRFNLERLNELEVFWAGEEPKETRGFHNVLISEGYHPYWANWWPHGHMIGWEHSFVHEFHHFFDAIVNNKNVAPYGATFEDGYRNAVICDAILESARSKRAVDIKY